MKLTNSFQLDVTRDDVAQVLCSEGFNVDREKAREGVVSTDFAMTRDEGGTVEFELRSVELRRKRTGGLDRSATVRTVTRHSLDRTAGVMTWAYEGAEGKLLQLGGVYRITPDGDSRTRVVHEITIDVRVPIIGGQIAKLIARGFDRPDGYYRGLFERYLD